MIIAVLRLINDNTNNVTIRNNNNIMMIMIIKLLRGRAPVRTLDADSPPSSRRSFGPTHKVTFGFKA